MARLLCPGQLLLNGRRCVQQLLTGVKVIELEGLAPVPHCGMMLADFGAQVTVVERKEDSKLIEQRLSRGKQKLDLDLKAKVDVAKLKEVLRSADVLLDPYRPGVLEKMDLHPEALLKNNERLVVCRLTGYGQYGPMSQEAGHDINFVAMSGLMPTVSGQVAERPWPAANLLADFAGGGLTAAFGVVAALFQRSITGKGCLIDCSMTDGLAYLGSFVSQYQHLDDWWSTPYSVFSGRCPVYRTYKTKDGKFVAVGALEKKFQENLFRVVGLNAHQKKLSPEDLSRDLEAKFSEKTRDEWATPMDTSNCSQTMQTFLTIYTNSFMFPTFLAYAALAVALICSGDAFHPLFTACFVILVASYAMCNFLLALRAFLELVFPSEALFQVIDVTYLWFYMYIQPIVLIALIERLCATIFVKKYEKTRFWSLFFFAQVLSVLIVFYEISLLNSAYGDLTKTVQLLFSLFIALCLICLLFVNRRLTLASRAKSSLTMRYQLAENVKALRVFVPYCVLDNSLSLMYVASAALISVDYTFDQSQCEARASYLPIFIILRTVLNVVQIVMPVLVVRQHPSLWTSIRRRLRTSIAQGSGDKKTRKIRNVLGMDITGLDEDHFAQLQQAWLKKF